MKHIIGIDFGTSTSMIKTAIRNGNADSLETKPVTFTQQGIGATPTLIRKLGDTVWYGFEAEQNERLDAPLIRNFKLGLRSENPEEKKQATAYVQEFYAYLYVQYQEQKSFLFGMEPGEEETWVSYPVQWSEEQRNVVLDAARTAGFPNVHGLDEPTAAVICILKAKQRELEAAGLLRQGKPLHAVVLDMGAGTTDLAFITVTVDAKGLHTNLRGIWPDAGSQYIYGGSQMDARLEELLEKWVESCGFPPDKAYNMVVAQRSAIKHWKENTVSPLLANGQTVSDYAGLSATLNMMGQMMGLPVQPFPGLSKERFFAQFAPELKSFVEVISSAPQKLRNETELVILTGGNSEWFWVRDVLLGKESQYGDVGLKGIQSDKNVIRMGQPAETVSRGLVYNQGFVDLFTEDMRKRAINDLVRLLQNRRMQLIVGLSKNVRSVQKICITEPQMVANNMNDMQEPPNEDTRKILFDGKCGPDAFWRLYDDGELNIYGTGNTDDFHRYYTADTRSILDRLLGKPNLSHLVTNIPWDTLACNGKITSFVVDNGITVIGNCSCICPCVENIQLPDSLKEINHFSLWSEKQQQVVIPKAVSKIGKSVFGAFNVIFLGNMPIMEEGILWDSVKDNCLLCYPSNDKTWDISKLTWTDQRITWFGYETLDEAYCAAADNRHGPVDMVLEQQSKKDFKMLVDRVDGYTILGRVFSGKIEEGEYVIVKGDDRILRMKVFAIYRDNETEECKVATPGMKAKLTVDDNRNLSKGTILNKLTLTDEERGKVIASGDCGEFGGNVKWKFMGDGTLDIYGSGLMKDLNYDERMPWAVYNLKIYSIHIADGVENIGCYAFEGCCVKSITFPSSLMDFNTFVFRHCGYLKKVIIPPNVVGIGYHAFEESGLHEIVFLGNMPNLRFVFDGLKHNFTIFYPKNNPTWSPENRKDIGSRFATWKESEV